MRIPKSFLLYGEIIKVIFVKKCAVEGKSAYGYCEPDKNIIYIEKNLEKSIEFSTFLHELTHMILFTMERTKLAYNEKFAREFSGLLHEYISTSKF